jgi:putative DNA primase/helicase
MNGVLEHLHRQANPEARAEREAIQAEIAASGQLTSTSAGEVAEKWPEPECVQVAIFPNVQARQVRRWQASWSELVERIKQPRPYPTKDAMPLIMLAELGETRSDAGSLRHEANVQTITGVALDYDAAELSIADAAMLMSEAGVTGVFYSSPSSAPERPRWRLLLPTSRPLEPPRHRELVARANAILGGVLAPESFKLAQSYYIGRAENAAHYEAQEVRGHRCIDHADDIVPLYPKDGKSDAPSAAAQALDDPVLVKLRERGLYLRVVKPGIHAVRCPWESEHTGETTDSATAYLQPNFDGRSAAGFKCLHGHCSHRSLGDLLEYLGLGSKGSESSSSNSAGDDSSDWPEPLPLVAKVEPEPYPLDALPAAIRDAIEEVQQFTKAPVALVASSALAALSLAIQAQVDIKRAEKLTGPTGLFVLTIADSGERKTTVDGFFTKAIRDYEARQAEAAKPLFKDYEAALTAWTTKREGIKDRLRKLAKAGQPTHQAESELRDLEHDKPEPPRVPRLIYTDTTPEALKWSLAKGWPSGGVVSSEAGIVFGSHGMGKDSVMRNLATLNQLWDATAIATERRTSESFTVKGARLSIALQVQETTLREFFDRSGALARGTGFLARFLIAWPASTQGFRPFTEPPEHWPHLAQFNRRLATLLEQPVAIAVDGALSPTLMMLALDAKEAWIAFHNLIEAELRAGGKLYDVRDVASKTADNAARLAALLQVFDRGIGVVGAEYLDAAARIAAWHHCGEFFWRTRASVSLMYVGCSTRRAESSLQASGTTQRRPLSSQSRPASYSPKEWLASDRSASCTRSSYGTRMRPLNG